MILPAPLETSGGVLSAVDMQRVQQRDGRRRLRDHDESRIQRDGYRKPTKFYLLISSFHSKIVFRSANRFRN